ARSASYTSPMPPAPTNRTTRHGPTRASGESPVCAGASASGGSGNESNNDAGASASASQRRTFASSSASPAQRSTTGRSRSASSTSSAASTTSDARRQPSSVRRSSVTECDLEPRARSAPVAVDRARAHAEHLGGLLLRQPGEEATLDNARQSRVDVGEAVHRVVEREHGDRPLL